MKTVAVAIQRYVVYAVDLDLGVFVSIVIELVVRVQKDWFRLDILIPTPVRGTETLRNSYCFSAALE